MKNYKQVQQKFRDRLEAGKKPLWFGGTLNLGIKAMKREQGTPKQRSQKIVKEYKRIQWDKVRVAMENFKKKKFIKEKLK